MKRNTSEPVSQADSESSKISNANEPVEIQNLKASRTSIIKQQFDTYEIREIDSDSEEDKDLITPLS